MIDPVIFSVEIFGLNLTLRWYGVIVMIGVIAGSLIVERGLRQRGENGDRIWDALIWVLPAGIIGARLWYVFNAVLGGNRSYLDNPASIFRVWEGGLHIFGGFLLGSLALLYYLRQNKLDPWLFLDATGPAALVGQGIGRLANFINQELYGPPTTLPWGIPISAEHRLPQFQDLGLFPVESTRFHPTFAYEMLWNFASAGLLLWLSRRYKEEIKPGTIFAGWLVLAGIGRVIIEFFRPDQPKIEGLGITYTSIFAALMVIAGIILLLARYKVINPKLTENWEDAYKIGETISTETRTVKPLPVEKTTYSQKELTSEEKAEAAKRRREKLIGRKTINSQEAKPPAKRPSAKKSS
jgi:phosphatidylglycerol:prolipoprotein diacylglycerol transferase